MADGSVSMPCGRRDFTPGPVLRASVGSDSGRLSSAVKDCGKKLSGLEPFVDVDEAKRLAEEAERMRFLRQMARKKKQNDLQRKLQATVLDFDPKQGGKYYTRFTFADLTKFDLDEESPLGPMRFTDAVYKNKDDYELCEGLNFFSVRITTSDVGFPINVYGTVFARDSLDNRCVYLFSRGRDQCQLINSEDCGKKLSGLEPFVDVDEAKRLAEEAERMQFLRQMAREQQEDDLQKMLEDIVLDFDPKQGGKYYTRFTFADLTKFDLDEESPLGPMRFTDAVYKNKDDYELCEGINVFSVRITTSDVGFPINVYGTVIARDSLDKRCVYLFRRDRDQCQLINSEDESLILTGPKRGLALIGPNYVEIDLKIKDHQGQDKELSKGMLSISGIERRRLKQCVLESDSLATRLSTVDVLYGVVKDAVEGSIAIEVLQGDFVGKITAQTTSILNTIVLYDNQVVGGMAGDGTEAIKLMRSVVCVYVKDKLIIVAETSDGKSKRTIDFTPKINGREEAVVTLGVTKMRVKVTWSIMDF